MKKLAGLVTLSITFIMVFVVTGALFIYAALLKAAPPPNDAPMAVHQQDQPTATLTATETIPPNTPLATLTPSQTLRPPPTLEPPTNTPVPSATPSLTPTPTVDTGVSIPGLHGLETPTSETSAEGCEPRDDWTLIHTIQRGDALAGIAETYNTYVSDLVAGNCLTNPDVIVVGQQLRVPGEAPPVAPEFVCVPFELLTPIDGAFNVPGDGMITFNWRGPEAARYLVRIHGPDGSTHETVVDLRQNATVDVTELPLEGRYTWYVYPLDENFWQIDCLEGGPWTFNKDPGPTPTPEPAPQPSFMTDVQNGPAPLTVQFFDTSRGEITGYHWDFGDGTSSSEQFPTHEYDEAGTYFVKLTVYGPDESAFATTLINVH